MFWGIIPQITPLSGINRPGKPIMGTFPMEHRVESSNDTNEGLKGCFHVQSRSLRETGVLARMLGSIRNNLKPDRLCPYYRPWIQSQNLTKPMRYREEF